MALALAQYEDLFWLVSGYFKAQGMFPLLLGSVYHAAMPMHATPRKGPHTPSGPNLLDESFERLHSEPCRPFLEVGQEISYLGRKGKSRLTVNVYNLCRV